jgi:hypothetical protein
MSHAQDPSARDATTGATGPVGPTGPTGTTGATAGAATEPAAAGRPGDVTQQEPGAASARGYVPRPTQSFDDASYAEARPSGAALGLTITAAVLMMVSGLWSFLEGLSAIIKGSFFVVSPNYVYNINITGWGWIHLIIGVLVFTAGAFLFMDKMWARIVGVVLACCSAVASFLWIPYQPVWSVVVIALDVFIIWALLSPRTRYAA